MRRFGLFFSLLVLAFSSLPLASEEGAAAFTRSVLAAIPAPDKPCARGHEEGGPNTALVCGSVAAEFKAFSKAWDEAIAKSGTEASPLSDWVDYSGSRMRWYQVTDRWVVVTFEGADREIAVSYPRDRKGVLPLSAGVTPPKRLAPDPSSAEERAAARSSRKAEAAGVVVVSAVVKADGKVADVEVLGCLPHHKGLEQAAVQAVKRWKYKPGTLDGAPVSVPITATVKYGPSGAMMFSDSGSTAPPDILTPR